MNVIGLDIGGANLKASDGLQQTLSVEFPLWQKPEQLAHALTELLSHFPAEATLAVTMTGELADCFRTRSEGVQAILNAVSVACGDRDTFVWQTTGEFVSLEEAAEFPLLTAAANWHALATWAGRMSPTGQALVIDIGSTTTDLIPLEEGIPVPVGRTDYERLASDELVYLGVRRTPLCSLLSHVKVRGEQVGIARELFATTLDVHLWLLHLSEQPECRNTANGQPATCAAAGDRIARMVCADRDSIAPEDLQEIARTVHERELEILATALQRVLDRMESPPVAILLSGEGEFLAEQLLQWTGACPQTERIRLGNVLGASHSQGACAYALARLGMELQPETFAVWHSWRQAEIDQSDEEIV